MQSLAGVFWSALAIGFSGAMIPGPMLALVLSEGLSGSFLGTLGIVLGHVILEGALVLALALGAGKVLKRPSVGAVVGVIGGTLLAYMGGSVVLAAWHNPASLAAKAAVSLPAGPVVAGVLVSASNPAWIMWWSAVGVGYVAMSLRRGSIGLVAFYAGHTLSDWLWYGIIGALLVSGRNIVHGQAYLWIIAACGALLMGFGLFFIYLGIRQLRQGFAGMGAQRV